MSDGFPARPSATRRSISLRTTFVLTLLLAALVAAPGAAGARTSLSKAPDLTLKTRRGEIALGELRGKVVLVDFWASWCTPCRRSFPWLAEMSRRYADRGLVVLAIDLDKERLDAEEFLREFSPPFPVAFDPSGASAEAFEVRAMPSSFLLSRDGTVVTTRSGYFEKESPALERAIEEEVAK